tara:strand:+ start:287 stop:946 length:660 start_codon:yes stop_codon:yes gene_type:complete
MSKNQLHSFWPVLVGEFFNPEHILIKDELINFFTEYEKNLPEGNSQLKDKNYSGNYNLYQSKYNLHTEKNEALLSVMKFIAMSILEMVKKANESKLEELENKTPRINVHLTESWFIRYNQGGMVYPHNHDGCSWSCVYYVEIGKEAKKMNGSTYFIRPYQGFSKFDFGGSYMLNDQMVLNAEEGKLLVFPNYLYHGSHPFEGSKDRIVISANSKIDLQK